MKNTTLPCCLYILLHRHSATFTPALAIIAGKWKQPTFPQRWKTGRKAAPVDLGVFLVSTKGTYRKDSRKFMLSKAGTGPARQVQSALAWREGPLSYINASLFKGIVFPAILRYLFRYIMFPFPVWLPAVPFKMLHGIFFFLLQEVFDLAWARETPCCLRLRAPPTRNQAVSKESHGMSLCFYSYLTGSSDLGDST